MTMTTLTILMVSPCALLFSDKSNIPLDVLASFNAPRFDIGAPRAVGISAIPPPPDDPVSRPLHTASPPGDADEDFEASLVEGMESLLRQLAGDHPPGPMPDIVRSPPVPHPNGTTPASLKKKEGEAELSPEEEEIAWQKAVEMMLSGEGLEALGLDKNGERSSQPPAARNQDGGGVKPDFQETIRRTMESLNQPVASGSKGGGSGSTGQTGAPTNIAALLGQFGSAPSALDGLGGDDDELGGLLDGMMTQLMTREVLEEPMAELASKVSHLHSVVSFSSTCFPYRHHPYCSQAKIDARIAVIETVTSLVLRS